MDIRITINLKEDIFKLFYEELKSYNPNIPQNLSFNNLCFYHFNLVKKAVPLKRRQVEISTEITKKISNKSLNQDHYRVLNQIKNKSITGASLNPYLSKMLIKDPLYNDSLLNDWGFHHFHLGLENLDNNFFVERTSVLLFCYITDDTIFMLDILDHNRITFSNIELFKIFVYNWPQISDRFIMNDINPLQKESDQLDIQKCRDMGLISPLIIGEKVYFPPGGGFLCTGSSFTARMEAEQFAYHVNALEDRIKENPNELYSWFQQAIPENPPTSFNFKAQLNKNGLRVKEINTQLFLQLLDNKITIKSY